MMKQQPRFEAKRCHNLQLERLFPDDQASQTDTMTTKSCDSGNED